MDLFTVLDLIALVGFVGAWGAYSIMLDWTPHPRLGLNSRMNGYRETWMRPMLAREQRLFSAAGRHFNHGQRAFFFALGYLGWYAGPVVFLVSTAAVVVVIWRRQFASDSLRAVAGDAA